MTNMASRRSYIKVLGGTIIGGTLAGCTGNESDSNEGDTQEINRQDIDPQNLILGTSARGSSSYGAGQTFQRIAFSNSENLQITAQPTGGTVENIRLLENDNIDIAITNNNVMSQAKNSEGPFSEQPVETIPQTMFTDTWFDMYPLAREGSGIEYYEDLRGKNVWALWPGAAFRPMLINTLEELGIWEDVNDVSIDPSNIIGAIAEGRVDAFGAFGNAGNSIVGYNSELDARDDIDFHPIKMSSENKEKILPIQIPNMREGEIYGWDKDWNGETAVMHRTHNVYVAKPSIDSDVVYNLVALIHEYGNQYSEDQGGSAPDLSNPDNLTSAINSLFEVHPGATDYLQEINAWNDDWQSA